MRRAAARCIQPALIVRNTALREHAHVYECALHVLSVAAHAENEFLLGVWMRVLHLALRHRSIRNATLNRRAKFAQRVRQ